MKRAPTKTFVQCATAYREGREVAGVVLHGVDLGAELGVTLVNHVTHGGVDELVQDEHEGKELTGNDGQRQVEVEQHTGLGRGGEQHVGHGGGQHGLGGVVHLHVTARSRNPPQQS